MPRPHASTDESDELERLRREKDELEQLVHSFSGLLVAVDAAGVTIAFNAEAERIFGRPAATILGERFGFDAFDWDGARVEAAVADAADRGESERIDELAFTNPAGEPRHLGLTVHPARDAAGRHAGWTMLGRDITSQVRLESQLIAARKLEAVGQLAAGIAHEINTPTQFVGDNVRFLRDSFEALGPLLDAVSALVDARDDAGAVDAVVAAAGAADLGFVRDEVPGALEESLEGLERVANIVRAMKDFSHPGRGEKEPVDLNAALEGTLTVARNEWKYVADVETELDPTLDAVPCLPGEMNQVFLNLVVNAAHAIGERLGEAPGEKGTLRVVTRREGVTAVIEIGDDGCGVSEEVRARMFEPFFTTKEVGRGTGQGLAIAHAVVVDQHGGSIDVASRLGEGTTFTLRLPLDCAAREEAA